MAINWITIKNLADAGRGLQKKKEDNLTHEKLSEKILGAFGEENKTLIQGALETELNNCKTAVGGELTTLYDTGIAGTANTIEVELNEGNYPFKFFDQDTSADGGIYIIDVYNQKYAFDTYESLFDVGDIDVDKVVVGLYKWGTTATKFTKQ